jgi:hypothetical protein
MTSKTTAAPVRFDDGAGAFIECAIAGGARWHTYFGKPDAWLCSHCGTLARPETPPELPRPQEREEQFRPPAQPRAVRLRLQDGSVETLPLSGRGGFEIVVRPFGDDGYGAVVALPAHELHSLTLLYNRKETS